MTTVINNAGAEKLFVYDENGNMLQKTDEDGYVTEYSYSSSNLVKLINYNDEKKVFFEYNKAGKLVQTRDWLGETSFELDLLDRITRVNDHNGKTVGYAYDKAGNQTEIVYPDNSVVKYQYDSLKRMTEVIDNESITKYSFDKVGRITKLAYPNSLYEEYTYDPSGQLLRVYCNDDKNRRHLQNKYAYDPQGNVISDFKRDVLGDENQNIKYGYDKLNRLPHPGARTDLEVRIDLIDGIPKPDS